MPAWTYSYKNAIITPIISGLLIVLSGCSDTEATQPCDSSSTVSLTADICLAIEHNGLSNEHRDIIEAKVLSGITSINSLIPINDLRIRIVENQQLVIPEIGIGGYNPAAQELILAIDANFSDLDATLEENLIPQLAHEIHHAKRRRSVGYGNTLLEAMVTEGLADHFSIELTGIAPPPWTTAITGDELQSWIETAGTFWNQPYDHSAWFAGTDPNIPRWAGYSIGFELVKNYLAVNPGRLPSNLHNEPASSFEP